MGGLWISTVLLLTLTSHYVQCQYSRGGHTAFGPVNQFASAMNQFGSSMNRFGSSPNINQLLRGQQKLSDACTYLKTRTSIWGNNNAPFKLVTDGFHTDIRRASPIEVAIKPWSEFQPDNFTDFIIYARSPPNPVSVFEAQLLPTTVGRQASEFLGVFKVVREYAAGGRGFTCNPQAVGPDAFGSAEERRILINRAMKPNNINWKNRQPAIRQYAAVLWYPTEMAMSVPAVQFIAKVKSDGHWYELKSGLLMPYNPPDPWQSMTSSLSQYGNMAQQMRQFERQAEASTAF